MTDLLWFSMKVIYKLMIVQSKFQSVTLKYSVFTAIFHAAVVDAPLY